MNLNSIGIKYGTIAGIGVLLYFLLFYFIDKQMMLGTPVVWSSLLIYVVCMVWAVQKERSNKGNRINFRSALRTAFFVAVIANIIYVIAYYILMQVDSEALAILKEMTVENHKRWLPESEPAEIDALYSNFKVDISATLLSFARSTIGSFFLALPIAFLLRK